jgi:hypothetical protein
MSVTTDMQDPVIAEMIAAGLMKAPDAVIARDEDEDDFAELEAALEAEPAGVEMIERLEPIGTDVDSELSLALEGLETVEMVETTLAPEGGEELDLEALERALAAQAAREEVYAEQESVIGVVTAAATPRPARVAKAPKAAKSAKAPTPPKREARFAGTGAAGGYVASVTGETEIEALVDTLPKKVKEKAANLVDFVHKGRTLSVFTRVAVDIMKSEGQLTNERLVKAFTTEASKRGLGGGYTIGTARSQAGQQIALFGRLNIAAPKGGALVPNDTSKLWQALAA